MTVAFERVAPVFPVASVTDALAHYRKLGFEAKAYAEPSPDGPIYGFLSWGPVEIHLALTRGLDPKTTTSACYLYVSDANALHAQWRAADVYQMRELGRHVPSERAVEDSRFGLVVDEDA